MRQFRMGPSAGAMPTWGERRLAPGHHPDAVPEIARRIGSEEERCQHEL